MTTVQREIFKSLEELMTRYPTMRFGQLLVNIGNWASGLPDGLWDIEDEAFLKAAQNHLAHVLANEAVAQK